MNKLRFIIICIWTNILNYVTIITTFHKKVTDNLRYSRWKVIKADMPGKYDSTADSFLNFVNNL